MKFVFDNDSLEVVLGNESKETENAFVGGENKWKFSTFTNWEFWWPNFPVLVYFKVTQKHSASQLCRGRSLLIILVQTKSCPQLRAPCLHTSEIEGQDR